MLLINCNQHALTQKSKSQRLHGYENHHGLMVTWLDSGCCGRCATAAHMGQHVVFMTA